jgi:hypothetical protein
VRFRQSLGAESQWTSLPKEREPPARRSTRAVSAFRNLGPDRFGQKRTLTLSLTEILDAHHLFHAVTGKYKDMGLPCRSSKPRQLKVLQSSQQKRFRATGQIAGILDFTHAYPPVDPLTTSRSDPSDWDKRLKDLGANKYVLFIGVDRARSRVVQFAQADDLSIASQTERPRTYIWDLRDPLQDD